MITMCFRHVLARAFPLAALVAPVQAQTLALALVPVALPRTQRVALNQKRTELLRRWEESLAKKSAFKREFKGTQDGTPRAEVAERRKAILKAEADAIVDDADAFNGPALLTAIDTALVDIQQRLPKTRKELEQLTPQLLGFQAAVDEWLGLADDARNMARHSAKEQVTTLLLEMVGVKKESEIQLDEKALKKIDTLLRKRVFLDDHFAQVITTERLVSLRTDRDVINILKAVQAALVLHSAWDTRDREEVEKAVLKGIEVVSRDPRITLLIADGEITIDAAYGWLAHKVAEDRVNQLLNLGDTRFEAVRVLTALYNKDIDTRKALLAARPK
jgi:hypothetical protein